MAATSLIPIFLSLALLSKTALDLRAGDWGQSGEDARSASDKKGLRSDVVELFGSLGQSRGRDLGGRGNARSTIRLSPRSQRRDSETEGGDSETERGHPRSQGGNSRSHGGDSRSHGGDSRSQVPDGREDARRGEEWWGTQFRNHQVNLGEFYSGDPRKSTENTLQSRSLRIEEDMEDLTALESQTDHHIIPNYFTMESVKKSLRKERKDEDVAALVDPQHIEDQIAMESVKQHLKTISQLPPGLVPIMETDLIRKLTSVRPTTKITTAASTEAPEILIKHMGSPTPGSYLVETNSVTPRPERPSIYSLWSDTQRRKAIRFPNKGGHSSRFGKDKLAKKLNDRISLSTLKPKIKSFLDKYSSSTIDPILLIRKYHRSQQSTTLPSTISRKYPTKFLLPEKAEVSTKSFTNDTFRRYTTSTSFRRPQDDKSQSPMEESYKGTTYGHKLGTTEREGLRGVLAGNEEEEREKHWRDEKRREEQKIEERRREAERMEERRREEERVRERRREEEHIEERRREDIRKAEERNEERREEAKREEARREDMRKEEERREEIEIERARWEEIRRRGELKREEERDMERKDAERRIELEEQRREFIGIRGDSQDFEDSVKEETSNRGKIHTTLVPVQLHKVSVSPTNLVYIDGYYKKTTAPGTIDIQDQDFDRVVSSTPLPPLKLVSNNGFMEDESARKDYQEDTPVIARKVFKKRKQYLRKRQMGLGQTLRDIFFPNLTPRRFIKVRGAKEEPRRMMRVLPTTARPILTTLSAIKRKFPSILVEPFSKMRTFRRIHTDTGSKAQETDRGSRRQENEHPKFPYTFQKPVSIPGAPTVTEMEAGMAVDRQLISPGDPGLDIPEVLRTYLPAFMSLGTGLGIALHTILSNWDAHVIARELVPSLRWTAEDQVLISYSDGMDIREDDIIPMSITKDGTTSLGHSGGRGNPYTILDPVFSSILLGLLPEDQRGSRTITIDMDKYVFFRVILTYLYQNSLQLVN